MTSLGFVVNCGQCGTAYSWQGLYTDMPPCPACGWRPDRSVLEEFQRRHDLLRHAQRRDSGGEPTGEGGA